MSMINRNLTYVGMAKTRRGWKHVSWDADKRILVPTPKELIPREPEKKHP